MAVVIPVIGAPRTGTSLVASILHELGVFMGDKFTQAPDSTWTPGGSFWADAEFNALHESLMRDGDGTTVQNPKVWDDYQALIMKREAAFATWGYKDYWLSVLWPDIAPRFSHVVQPIFLSRDPDAQADSYQARKAVDITGRLSAKIALSPFIDAVAEVRKAFPTALVIPFESLTGDLTKSGVVGTIAAYVGKPAKQTAVDLIDANWVRF